MYNLPPFLLKYRKEKIQVYFEYLCTEKTYIILLYFPAF